MSVPVLVTEVCKRCQALQQQVRVVGPVPPLVLDSPADFHKHHHADNVLVSWFINYEDKEYARAKQYKFRCYHGSNSEEYEGEDYESYGGSIACSDNIPFADRGDSCARQPGPGDDHAMEAYCTEVYT